MIAMTRWDGAGEMVLCEEPLIVSQGKEKLGVVLPAGFEKGQLDGLVRGCEKGRRRRPWARVQRR